MASSARPQQFVINTCFAGSTNSNPLSQQFTMFDFGFTAVGLTFCNDGVDRVWLNLGTTSSACSTGTGFPILGGEQFGIECPAPMATLCTTSSAGVAFRGLALRW